MTTRTVTVVTGTRADYGLLKPAMAAIEAHEDLSLSVVATGMHLREAYGRTVTEIRADGFSVDRAVRMHLAGDTPASMAKSLGIGIAGLTDALQDIGPDVVLVLGDRDEAFAAGVAAAHMNLPVAHVHGGDVMQGALIDDSIRHALTKFAHLHFPVSERSSERIERLGEEPWRITTVGAPGLDAIRSAEFTPPDVLSDRYEFDVDGRVVLALQHPLTTAPDDAGAQMRATLDALASVEDATVVLVYPNADAGSQRVIATIEDHPATDRFHTFESLPREDFLGVMNVADAMVGNSSSAIFEAPSLDLPVVDVGPRQAGRERADNTIQVAHDGGEITAALERCLEDDPISDRASDCENPYDYGGAGHLIADRLADVDLDDSLLRKQLTY